VDRALLEIDIEDDESAPLLVLLLQCAHANALWAIHAHGLPIERLSILLQVITQIIAVSVTYDGDVTELADCALRIAADQSIVCLNSLVLP
jgi:uncharacterized Rossmann fold enzyme